MKNGHQKKTTASGLFETAAKHTRFAPDTSKHFSDALESWFNKVGKNYPWRNTRDPYAILVSEIMLQQTQIATVLGRGYYQRWMSLFPDFQSLATAEEESVLKAWEGLGYYRRARNLQKLAQTIITDHNGVFPAEPSQIKALPGIGPYTAGALSSFAFGLREPLVDGNVMRLFARLFDDPTPIDDSASIKAMWDRAEHLVQACTDPAIFNSALMEIGQHICITGRPHCDRCPVQSFCTATDPASLPVKKSRVSLTPVDEHVFFHREHDRILLQQETGKRRTGLWKLPALPSPDQTPVISKSRYGITRYSVTLWVHESPRPLPEMEATRWFSLAELETVTMPSPYRRALKPLLSAPAQAQLL